MTLMMSDLSICQIKGMRTEVVTLTKSQRNRLLGKETTRDPKAKYLVEVAVRPTNGNEYYKAVYDSRGKRVGGNLSISK